MMDQLIPAVLSIEEGEPGFRPDWQDIAFNLNIFVDGVEQRNVVSYSCNAGLLKRLQVSEDGRFIVEGDQVVLETIHGTVEVLRKLK
ncbi:hypothetical protein [Sphingomonas sp. TREG-RG-20F-R18-01]|uniref:hypothetical protein n=1 Tax=Sphingomonas sp. TREG-RG-20F-R18-01 TaxID=2914982 RepID=UPI001F55BCDE|nr:hypothetical protein [Sphingomonas sp. TREG-RG-20F-R18-01]